MITTQAFDKANKHLSYSSIKRFIDEGYEGFLNPVYKKNNALELGSIIDKLVFKEEITETILDIQIPKPQIKELIHTILDSKKQINLESVQEACNIINVKSKNYTLHLKSILEYNDYIHYFLNPKGYFLKQNYDKALKISEIVLKDKECNYLFSGGTPQFENTFQYKGFKIFTKLDYLKIDKDKKEIIITDLKSSSYPANFPNSIEKYLYHLQGIIYLMSIEDYVKKNDLEEFTLRPFHWVVTNTIKLETPLILPLSYTDEKRGKIILDDALDNLDKYLNGDTLPQTTGILF